MQAASSDEGSRAWYLAQSQRGEQLLAAGRAAEAAQVFQAILNNIYLQRNLDEFAETVLIPEYTRGTVRRMNPDYAKVTKAIGKAFQHGDRAAVRQLRARRRAMPARGSA